MEAFLEESELEVLEIIPLGGANSKHCGQCYYEGEYKMEGMQNS